MLIFSIQSTSIEQKFENFETFYVDRAKRKGHDMQNVDENGWGGEIENCLNYYTEYLLKPSHKFFKYFKNLNCNVTFMFKFWMFFNYSKTRKCSTDQCHFL